jgi:translocation and assembly module TamA
VRGFKLDQLGPLDRFHEPVGGFTLAEASIELRFPIWRDLGGVAFVDAGQVALDSFDLRAKDFYYSAGGGLRYKTPIGPLRLDLAQVLNPPSGISSFGFYFSVGHAF